MLNSILKLIYSAEYRRRVEKLNVVKKMLSLVSCEVFSTKMEIFAELDPLHFPGRIYIQGKYFAPCNKSGEMIEWKTGKHYLSDHITYDEIYKRCWVCFRDAVTHEMMEGFKINDKLIFNPHTPVDKLASVSQYEDEVDRSKEPLDLQTTLNLFL